MKAKRNLFVSLVTLMLLLCCSMLFAACDDECGTGGSNPTYTVAFKVDGRNYDIVLVEEGKTVTLPADPEKDGYTFDGWYADEACLQDYTASAVSQSIDVYAKFTANVYTITYETDGGTHANATGFTVEDKIVLTDAEKIGYAFEGWYLNGERVSSVPKGTMGNVTLTAKYIANGYSVTYQNTYNAANTNPKAYSADGVDIALAPLTDLKAFTFLGWYEEGDDTPVTTISAGTGKNVTLVAKWEEKQDHQSFLYNVSEDGDITITGVKDKTVTEIIVPDYVYSIDLGAFKDCTSLQKLTVPYVGNRSNGEYGSIGYFFGAKSYKDNLTVMPETLTNITVTGGYNNDEALKTGAFYDCRYLTDVVIGDGVTAMGNGIFYDNFALTNLTVPFAGESKKTHPDSYMYPFNWLFTYSTSDTIDNSFVGDNMYRVSIDYIKLSSPWSTETSDFNHTMYGYVPRSLKQITVNGGSIPYECFWAFKYVEKIVLGDGVDYIGAVAFSNCEALTELVIPDSVTRVASSIGSTTRCPVMATMEEKAKNGDGYWYIGKVLYRYYGTEEDLVIKDGTVSICSDFLNYNTNISNIKTLKCPDSLRYIGCDDSYEGTCLFYGCTNLTKVELNEGLEFIHGYAFYECTALSDIDFPDSVKYVGIGAFYNTAWYNNLPDGDVYIGKVYYKYKGEMTEDTTVTIKDGTYCISGVAFSKGRYASTSNENDKLVAVNIPDSVEWIADGAFANCVGLRSITLPKNLTHLGEQAFYNCTSLEGTVVIPAGVEILSHEVFGNTNISELRFAEGSKLKYLATESIPSGCTTWLPNSVERFVKYIKTSGDAIIMLPEDNNLVLMPYWHGDELSTSATICYMGSVADYYKYGDFVAYYSEEEPEKNPDGTYVGVAYDGYSYKGSYWHYDENGKPVLW